MRFRCKSGAWALGVIIAVWLLLYPQPGPALAEQGCSPKFISAVRTVGGHRFEIAAVLPLPDLLPAVGPGSGCAAQKPDTDFSPAVALHSAALAVSPWTAGNSVVIVIDDFGYRNDWVVDGFLSLDAAMTFAVIPGHQFSAGTAARARQRGHEVLLHMPMQALGPAPGEIEYRLTTTMNASEITTRVRRAFAEIPQAVGMNNHQGSAATGDARVMDVLAAELRRTDMFFLDSVTTPDSVALQSMRAGGVAAARRDIFIDNVDDLDYVLAQLQQLARLARERGYAVGIGHVRPNTLRALQQVLPQLQASGQRFAFLSEVVRLAP